MDLSNLYHDILNVQNVDFDSLTLKVFAHQFTNNAFYKRYCQLLGRTPDNVFSIDNIPFLPIQFFKSHEIQTGDWTAEAIFQSSGTTGQTPSKHYVRSTLWYLKVAESCFQSVYGYADQYCWLGLLPSYLERQNSSLVMMVDYFIKCSNYSSSGFFLNDLDGLIQVIEENEERMIPTILIGVSFALLDLAEKWRTNLNVTQVMETGGMKGRRKEMLRSELHEILKDAFNVPQIQSEYGMTELLSQSYSKGLGRFVAGPTKRILIADLTDPLTILPNGRRGVIHIVDLGNIDTCSFIATEDMGIRYDDNSFEVIGRLDRSEMRGCNLMFEAG